ncbi:MAG: MBL fold metallo-hydrolase [Bacteriovorax sp.]|jgi:glyoxylase-like metal-dependent hydrolase (beta-lactamase superfamily II)|nr:MBL fold metallo-hydrolase [Bacteriovorax sp.]
MQSKKYFALEPARFKLDGGAMFGIIPKPLWSKVHPADELNRIELALRLILVITETKKILIDTGIGDYHGDKFNQRFAVIGDSSPLEKALNHLGIEANEITDLIISHLHFDHVGGIGRQNNGTLEPVLKKARLHLHKKHYEYSLAPTQRDAGSFHQEDFVPIIKWYIDQNQIHWLSDEEGEIMPELKYRCSMGHTPYLIHPYDDRFIYMADLIPTSNHVSIPWVMGYDISPGVTTMDKLAFLDFIQANHLTMIFEHDPLFYGSTVKKEGKADYRCDQKKDGLKSIAYAVLL